MVRFTDDTRWEDLPEKQIANEIIQYLRAKDPENCSDPKKISLTVRGLLAAASAFLAANAAREYGLPEEAGRCISNTVYASLLGATDLNLIVELPGGSSGPENS